MTKSLTDLVDDFQQLTDSEAMDIVRKVRANKYMAKPAVAQRQRRQSRKKVDKAADAVRKMFGSLSPEERAKLLEDLDDETE